jgi:hypothetical protein
VFEFGYQECSDVQVEALLDADGLSGIPATVAAGELGIKLTNESDGDVGFGVIRVYDDNTATTEEIVTAIFASEDDNVDGVEFVGGGAAPASDAGYSVSPVKAGRYLFVVFNYAEESDTATGVAEFTVS